MERIVYDGFVTVKEVEVNIKDKTHIYNELCVKDVVAAILVDEEGKIGIVNQFRPFVSQVTKEIVAETMDKKGLSMIDTLIEGLNEEAGITKDEIIRINQVPKFNYFMMVSCSTAELFIYEIFVKKQENKFVDDEDVESVEWVTLDEMKTYIDEGKIKDAKTILTYYYLANKKNILD